MSESEATRLLRDTQGVTVDAAEAEAALAVARAAGAAVASAADRLMTLDETPWSFDTLRARVAKGATS